MEWIGKLVLGTVLLTGYTIYGVVKMDTKQALCYQTLVKPASYSIKKESIDQIFRDHGGYRLYSQDPQTGKVLESSFYETSRNHPIVPEDVKKEFLGLNPKRWEQVNVYRDLNEREHPFAKTLEYTIAGCKDHTFCEWSFLLFPDCDNAVPRKFYYVEVHLPKNQGLAAGNDTDGKTPKSEPMREIK